MTSDRTIVKILHVVPTYLPARRYGGPIVAVHGLCKALAARGHDVRVFTTNVDGNGVLDVPTGIPVPLDGVSIHYFPSTFRRLYLSPLMRRALQSSVGEVGIVHSHSVFLWPGVAAAAAARRAGVPYVISPRGMLVPELIRRKSTLVKRMWLSLVERRALADAAAVHFTTELERQEAARVGVPLPSPLVIPNGIDLLPRPPVPREERTLLHLGRVTWKKRIDAVIETLPRLPGVRFIIAGNDEEGLTPRLRELAARTGVGDRVEFTGPVYGDAKQELLARATLFVLASRSENFGNAVLEAMAMDTPVVLSAGVGLAGEVAEAGAGAIGLETISDLLHDPQRRAEMGRRGRVLVEARFTWPRVAERFEEVYCSIRSRRSS